MHKVFILFFTFVLINADEIVDTNLVKVDFEERIKTENIQKVTLKKLLKQKNQLFLSNYLLKNITKVTIINHFL